MFGMSAIQKYRQKSEELARQVTELKGDLEKCQKERAWFLLLATAGPLEFANLESSMGPEIRGKLNSIGRLEAKRLLRKELNDAP